MHFGDLLCKKISKTVKNNPFFQTNVLRKETSVQSPVRSHVLYAWDKCMDEMKHRNRQ